MACRQIYLRTRTLPDAPGGGTWSFAGYHASDPEGSPGSGGSDPTPLDGDNPLLDFAGFTPGYYFFDYNPPEDECGNGTRVVVWVQPKGSPGDPSSVEYCVGSSATIDMFTLLAGEDTWGQFVPNPDSPDDPSAGLSGSDFDLSAVSSSPGTYWIDYIIDVEGNEEFDPINCVTCKAISTIVIHIVDVCDAGSDNTFVLGGHTGDIDLFDLLGGTPDLFGTWAQTAGDTVTIDNGYYGTVNFDMATGCQWVFRYRCPGPAGCRTEAFVTVIRNAPLIISITQDGNDLVADVNGCEGTLSLQWQRWNGSSWVNVSGATNLTLTPPVNQSTYRLLATCSGCQNISDEVYFEIDCSCNNQSLGLTPEYDPVAACLYLTPTGNACSPIASDTIQWRYPNGSWQTYSGGICGCNIRHYFDVTGTCEIRSNNVRIGWNNPLRCTGTTIDRVYIKFGNGTLVTYSGNYNSFSVDISASNFVNLYNREAVMRIRLNLGNGNFLFKLVRFYYAGPTSGPSCADVTIQELNDPVWFREVEFRRVYTFSDGCPGDTFQDEWQGDNCTSVFLNLTTGNVNGVSAVIATAFNCWNCPSTVYTWYKDGILLTGQTDFWVNRNTYGEGYYEAYVTCCGCSGYDSITTNACTFTLTLSSSGNDYTVTVNGCSGTRVFKWYRWENNAWVEKQTATNSNTTNTYSAPSSGQYKIEVCCQGTPTCCKNIEFTHVGASCDLAVVLNASGSNLTATVTGCSGTRVYTWQRWNGSSWVTVRTETNSSNTDSYTATNGGLHRVIVYCNATQCDASDTIFVNLPCGVTVVVTGPVSGTYTATSAGCTGSRTWTWERWNGSGWTVESAENNSSNTSTFTPTQSGLYRVKINCAANGCEAIAQFNHTQGCSVSVTIARNANLLTANPVGCVGSITYTWYYRATPGSGSWGSPIANSQTINTNTWGDGEYKVVVTCGGCEAEATIVYTGCDYTLSLNCASNNPFSAVVTGCAGTVTYQWQYSPTGFGWINLGTSQNQMPTQGEGYYRVNTWCNGVCPKNATCFYEPPCSGSVTLDADFVGIDWEVFFNSSGTTEAIELYFNGGGPQVSGSYNLSLSAGRNALKAAIESWLASNGGGAVTVGYDRNIGYIGITCTRAVLDRARLGGINFWAGEPGAGRTCDYSFSVPDSHFVGLYINDKFWYSAANPLPFATQSTQIRDIILDLFVQAGVGASSVTVNTNGTIVIEDFYGSMGRITGSAGANQSVNHYSASRTSCNAINFRYPELTADISGCQGNPAIQWQFRPTIGFGTWSTIQTGGTTLFTCTYGEYRVLVSCGGCEYEDNFEFEINV